MVTSYFAAINAGDFRTAWSLGGDNLDSSYSGFVDGFAGTSEDVVTITGVSGSTVSVSIDAIQSDGSDRQFAGTYEVRGGRITAASITATGGDEPGTEGPPGVLMAPNGDFYRAGEYCPDRDHYLTTVDASGNTLVCVSESGRYHWRYQ